MRLHDLRFATLPFLASAALCAPTGADCQLAWSTGWSNYTIGPSHVAGSEDKEVADDFDFHGAVTRILANGNGPFCCGTTAIDGVWVRFYQWTAAGPGALEQQYFLGSNDPGLIYLPLPQTLDVRLPVPFQASGQHFVSVQVDFSASGYWYWWTGPQGAPQLSKAYIRDNHAGGSWAPYIDGFGQPMNADASFELYGIGAGSSSCGEWVESPTAIPSVDHSILRDVAVIAPDDVWAVGEMSQQNGPDLETAATAQHFDGSAWTTVPVPNPSPYPGGMYNWLDAVAAVGSDDVWAAGMQRMVHPFDHYVGQQLLVMHWNGASWSIVPAPITPAGTTGAQVYDIEVVAADDIWFFGEWLSTSVPLSKPALAMHWNGSSFQILPTPNFSSQGHSLVGGSALGPNDVWAVGGAGDGADPAGFSYIVHWDGSQWTLVPGPVVGLLQTLNDVVAIAPDDVWLCGESWVPGAIVPLFQHWNGSTWTTVQTPGGGAGLFASSSNDVWSSGGNVVHWDGTRWGISSDLACIPGASLIAIDGVGAELWSVGRQASAGLIPLAVQHVGSGGGSASAYCTAKVNSLGCTPSMSASGCPQAASGQGFTLQASNLLALKSGVLFYGTHGAQAAPFQGGFLCVVPPIVRLPVQSTGGSTGQCDGFLATDFNAVIAAGSDPQLVAGAVVAVQAWSRDPQAPFQTSLSNALSFVIAP